MEEVLAKLSEMNDRFGSLRQDVDNLMTNNRARSRSPVRLSTPVAGSSRHPSDQGDNCSTPWCDRDPSEKVDYSLPIYFSDEENGEDSSEQLVEVSEQTAKLLKNSCTRGVSNESRRKTRSAFHLPKVPATRTPRLDQFLKTEIPQPTKSLDKDLSKIQTFVLDALAPLTAMVEADVDALTPEQLQKATTAAVQLLGNASAHISRVRREKVVTALNKSLMPLVKDDTPYMDAAPDLFGSDFAQRSKEFLEQVKAIRSSLPTRSSGNPDYKGKPLFRKGQSSGRTGAYNRGGASNQYRPNQYRSFRGGRGDRRAHQDKN